MQDKSPLIAAQNRKSSALCVSRLLETDRPMQFDSPVNYDPEKLYFNDPEIKALAESSRKFRSLTWKDPNKQSEYFRVLRESDLLDYKFYGHPAEVMELKLSRITGLPPQSLPQNRHSDVTQYSTLNDVKRELAQSNYMTKIRNSTYINTSQRDDSGLHKSYAGPYGTSQTTLVGNRHSNVIFSQKAENLVKSQFVVDSANTEGTKILSN